MFTASVQKFINNDTPYVHEYERITLNDFHTAIGIKSGSLLPDQMIHSVDIIHSHTLSHHALQISRLKCTTGPK